MEPETQVNNLKIFTHAEFDKSPLSNIMSYEQYFNNCLKQNSLYNIPKSFKLTNDNSTFGFGFATNPLEAKKEAALAYAKDFHDRVKNEIDEHAKEKEAEKNAAEEAYYIAVGLENDAKKAAEEAQKQIEKDLAYYGEDSSEYAEAIKKYTNSVKTQSSAETARECAAYRFNSASKASRNAFYTKSFLS